LQFAQALEHRGPEAPLVGQQHGIEVRGPPPIVPPLPTDPPTPGDPREPR